MADKHFFQFPISAELYTNVIRYITDSRDPSFDKNELKPLLQLIVQESTSAGMRYFLLHSLDVTKVNSFSKRTARLTINAAIKGIIPVSKTIINALSAEQLVLAGDFLEQCLPYPS